MWRSGGVAEWRSGGVAEWRSGSEGFCPLARSSRLSFVKKEEWGILADFSGIANLLREVSSSLLRRFR